MSARSSASARRPRVLVISADVVGAEMAGVAIRAYELARALGPYAEVTLAGLEGDADSVTDVRTIVYALKDPRALRPHIARADVVVAQPQWPVISAWLRRSGARLIFDMYDPEPLEVLEFLASRPPLLRRAVGTLTTDRMLNALHIGHHFVCASGKQRDLWIGMMVAQRLITPSVYDRDPTLESVMATVPFGVPTDTPRTRGSGARSRFPGLTEEDEVILWNGGIWGWLDAPTAIRAVGILARERPRARLVFMGASAAGPARKAADDARRMARELGLLDRTVFFNDSWVPYGERGGWLLDADCAISTHVDHLETRFAFRTRLLDCLWSRLPVVCTRGDELADRVEREDLGATVPERDERAVAAALHRVLDRGRGAYAEQLARAAADYEWSRVAAPLIRYATSPTLPPRLGTGSRPAAGHRMRDLGFRAAMGAVNTLGIRWWPTL